jgi:putative ABC transport system permease protein
MNWIKQLFSRREMYSDLSEEIREHLAEKVEGLVATGIPRHEAERLARREFGNVSLLEERGREVWQWRKIEGVIADLRYTLRRLRKSPGFSLTVIVMLALSIAASGMVFSIVDLVLLHPFPFRDADRLMMPWEWHFINGRQEVAYPDFQDWRAQNHVFEDLAAYTFRGDSRLVLSRNGTPEEVEGTYATANLFSLLGVKPLLGRTFVAEEGSGGHDHVVVLSNAFWKRHFHADRNIVGQQVTVNGESFSIIGVLPPMLVIPPWADVWIPISLLPPEVQQARQNHLLEVVGHRRAGVSIQKVQADMEIIVHRLQQEYPLTNGPTGFGLITLRDELVGKIRPALWALAVAVGLVLFMTCANVANLLLLRSMAAQREIAVRSALGASRRRLLFQSLTESLLLSCAGVVLGLFLASLLLLILRTQAGKLLPRSGELTLTPSVMVITSVICIGVVGFCSLVPVLKLIQGFIFGVLKQDSRTTASHGQLRVQRALLGTEIALAVTVLIGTGLLLRSFQKLLEVELGFRPHHVITTHVTLPPARYGDEKAAHFFDRLLPSLQQLPGVDSVATVNLPPLTIMAGGRFAVADAPLPAPGHYPTAQFRIVSLDYFKLLHISLWSGREFNQSDCGSERILINRSMAQKYFGGADPTGKAILLGFFSPPIRKLPILGMVGDAKDTNIERDAIPTIYFCGFDDSSTLLVSTALDPKDFNVSLQKIVRAVDPDIGVGEIKSMDEIIDDSTSPQRISALLFSVFTGFALLITTTGVSSVLSYSLAQRSKEIAVRIAVGATRADLAKLLLRQTAAVVLPGIMIGLLLSMVFGRAMTSLLFHVAPLDAFVFTVVPVVVCVVVILAAGGPLRKGVLTNPVQVLRAE